MAGFFSYFILISIDFTKHKFPIMLSTVGIK